MVLPEDKGVKIDVVITGHLRCNPAAVNRRGLRPTIGVQCGRSLTAHKSFTDNLEMPARVGPSWTPKWVNLPG